MAVDEWASRLAKLDTCAVSDAQDKLGIKGTITGIVPLYPTERIAGRAVTVRLKTKGEEEAKVHLGATAVVSADPGDIIVIDAIAGTLDVELSEAELEKRRAAWKPRQNEFGSGALWRYAQTVGPAVNGAVTHPGAKAEGHVYADI